MKTDDVLNDIPSDRFGVVLNVPVPTAIDEVTAALKTEGFGVLTTIDVQQTLKTKLDVETAPYVILGACNPSLAHRALTIEPKLGLLLPCNVIVYDLGDSRSNVSVVDPMQMVTMTSNPDLAAVATEAAARLARVVDKLRASSQTP